MSGADASTTGTMKAFGIKATGPSVDVLEELEVPTPTLGPQDVLIRVHAAGLNPVDFKQRGGFGNAGALPEPKILGYDGAGVVEAVGSAVTLFKVGDRVWSAGVLNRNGTNAELVAIDERIVGHAPKNLSWAEAAAIPLALLTAWEGLFESLGLRAFDFSIAGKSLLVVPGAGGVGSFVIQLAKKLLGLTVIATASRPESIAACLELGADFTINHREPFKPQLVAKGFPTVDYIYCAYDADTYFSQWADITAPLGKIVNIVGTAKDLPLSALMSKRITVVWELMFTRALYNADPIQQHHILNAAARLVEAGAIRLPAIRVLPWSLEALKEGHVSLERADTVGKIVLTRF